MGYDLKKLEKIYIKAVREDRYKFHAPRGNSKLGNIPGFSLLPVITCSMEACTHCAIEGCYAVKNCLCHGYDIEKNNVLRAWTENTVMARYHLDELEECLEKYFSKKRPEFFRVHPSGDFFNVEYAAMWHRVMEKHPETQFLAFTKQWSILRKVPFTDLDSAHVVPSGWPGTEIPEDIQSKYYCSFCVIKGCEPPENALKCPGSCETCNACWMLGHLGMNVYFDFH